MDPDEVPVPTVLEEFLSLLRPITQAAYLSFVKSNEALSAQQMVVLSDPEFTKLLEVGGLAQLHKNPTFGVSHVDYKLLLKELAHELWIAACKVHTPVSTLSTLETAAQSYRLRPRLPLIDPVLEQRISPFFMAQGILDVVGEASSGKTQFCLQLLLNCITPISKGGLERGACYIHTEGDFPWKRWEQLKSYKSNCQPSGSPLRDDLLYIQRVTTVEEMDLVLERVRPLLRAKNGALLIIDSIAAISRELSNEQKSSVLYRWVSQLQETSNDLGITIITTNQVVDYIDDPPSTSKSGSFTHPKSSLAVARRHSSFMAGTRRVLPALGLRWSELVNARLALVRTSQHYDGRVVLSKAPTISNNSEKSADIIDEFAPPTKRRKLLEPIDTPNTAITPQAWEDAAVVIRRMMVLYSPIVPELEVEFFIDAEGVHGIP